MSEIMLHVVSWVCNLFSASVINVEFSYFFYFQLLRKMRLIANDTKISVKHYILNRFSLLYCLSSTKEVLVYCNCYMYCKLLISLVV